MARPRIAVSSGQLDTLLRMHKAGASLNDIAAVTGLSRDTVRRTVQRQQAEQPAPASQPAPTLAPPPVTAVPTATDRTGRLREFKGVPVGDRVRVRDVVTPLNPTLYLADPDLVVSRSADRRRLLCPHCFEWQDVMELSKWPLGHPIGVSLRSGQFLPQDMPEPVESTQQRGPWRGDVWVGPL